MTFYCPLCNQPEESRERRPYGNSKCRAGHSYPSWKAVERAEVSAATVKKALAAADRKLAEVMRPAQAGDPWTFKEIRECLKPFADAANFHELIGLDADTVSGLIRHLDKAKDIYLKLGGKEQDLWQG